VKYLVQVSREVEDAVADQVVYFHAHGAPDSRIERWLERLWDLVDSLSKMPRRFPVSVRESEMYGNELRRVNLGEYAIFYRVDEHEHAVFIVAFRHGKRRPWIEETDCEP
jgi:plasmid stabilization system protein ParE